MIPTITGQGAARARGLGVPARRLRCGGAGRRGWPCVRGDKEAWEAERESSANTHAMQMQNGKLCMRAMDWGARL
eukprot:892142-Pleurochrysis_carterae.AAC.8